MARTIDASTQAALAAGRIARNILIKFDFGSGTYGFFDGIGSITYNSVTYQGAGALFEIAALGASADGAANSISIKLNGNADTLTSNVLATIESEQYVGRPVTLLRRYANADTWAELSVETMWVGFVDVIRQVERAGDSAYLEAICESRALDLGRSGYRMRSDADQKQIDANDGSLRHLQAAKDQEIFWGRLPPVTYDDPFVGSF